MILNRQRRIRLPLKRLQNFLVRAQRAVRLPADAFTVCFVTDAEIARWNRAYRGKNRPTDVLSFPVDRRKSALRAAAKPISRSRQSYIGDVAIAPAVAQRNAHRFGRTFEDEMRILILHGILHLMGYDHETDAGQMERREQRLRRKLGLA